MHKCLFCQLANQNDHPTTVYQNDFVSCFLDHNPISEGHVLIVPKKHFIEVDTLDAVTANHIMQAAILVTKAIKQLYQPDGVSMMQNGGEFNDVGHYHLHVFPRFKNDGFGWVCSGDINADVQLQEKRSVEIRNAIGKMIAF